MTTFINNTPLVFTKRHKSCEQIIESTKEALNIIINSTALDPESTTTRPSSVEVSESATSEASKSDTVIFFSSSTLSSTNMPKGIAMNQGNVVNDRVAAEKVLKKRLNYIKVVLYGDVNEHVATSTTSSIGSDIDESKGLELSTTIQNHGIMLDLLASINILPFEARKDVALIFNNLIRKDINGFVEYCNRHQSFIITTIVSGYNSSDAALSCGSMARELVRYESLQRHILFTEEELSALDAADSLKPETDSDTSKYSKLAVEGINNTALVWDFFDKFVHLPNFEVASDAFNTLRDLLVSTR